MNPENPPYTEAADFLKLLANPNRLAVLCNLHTERRNVTELAQITGLPQAAMSSQLALLREAGLVSCEVNHRERLYYIADERVGKMIELLYSFYCAESE
ncbi:ArsR/SmtB family transcription factor [Neisseria weixii]|uniref:ArsR/SmtB family transcription factor n=1 Tax=Neisseria weixii TaxID=1853276 RepID=UPI00359F799A